MEISEKVKEALRPFAGQAMLIDAKQVWQPMNPGDGLIAKFEILGAAPDPTESVFGRPPVLDGISLSVTPNFGTQDGDEFIITLRNVGDRTREIDAESLAPTLLAKKQGLECFAPSDGPSYLAVTRVNINFMHQHEAGGSCLVNGKGRAVRMFLPPGVAISRRFSLQPAQLVEVPVAFELSFGEYQFLAGYGGGAHQARALATKTISFDVDQDGKPHLLDAADMSPVGPRERRRAPVCGKAVLEDGTPAAGSKVFLWQFPLAKDDPRAAYSTTTNQGGVFRFESVSEAAYGLTALRVSADGILFGSPENRHSANLSPLSLPLVQDDCALQLMMHPQPTFTVHGYTEAADPGGAPRSVRLILKKGDALPFETSTIVDASGRYLFRHLPAGDYQFFAGATGGVFTVSQNIDDLDLGIGWPEPSRERRPDPNVYSAELQAIMVPLTLQELHQAQGTYVKLYKRGFSRDLRVLGAPPEWSATSADSAGLIDTSITGLQLNSDGVRGSKFGYAITYTPSAPDEAGKISSYVISARPEKFAAGLKSFAIDERGEVRFTEADRTATRDDPALKQQ
jgi:hypothetical protein